MGKQLEKTLLLEVNFLVLKKYAYIVLFLIAYSTYAQKEAYNWYFGINAGVRFHDDGSVTALADGQTNTNEGCSSISDTNGNLLMYSDGRNVWDRNHLLMPNGDYLGGTGLFGDPSSTQSCIIIPAKNNPNILYIFTVDEPHHQNAAAYPNQFTGVYLEPGSNQTIPLADDGYNNGLNYSIVDLSVSGTNGSVGDVVTRNVPLITYDPSDGNQIKYKCSEKVTAVRNADATGYWVITQFVDSFYAFSVTDAGVNTTPVISHVGPTVPLSGYRRNAIGCIRLSPSGNYLAIAHQQIGTVTGQSEDNGVVYLYSFDARTGAISNPVPVVQNSNPYGVEFSAQEKKLYVSLQEPASGDSQVWQYDLTAPNVSASGIMVANGGPSPATLQLGPNGKIYKAVNSQGFLDVINSPEETGLACDFEFNAVTLANGTSSIFGLPPFISSLFSASITAKATCLGQATQFKMYVNRTIQSIVWDFGDATATSTDTEPNHTYAAPGAYTVTATVSYSGSTETITKNITITTPPVANTPSPMIVCDTDTDGFATVDLRTKNTEILGSQNPSDFTIYYYTSQINADTNTNPVNAAVYTNVTNPQTMYVRVVSNANTECFATTSFTITVLGKPAIFVTTLAVCDDNLDGNDANARATFSLPTQSSQLLSNANFTLSWYASQTDADAGTNPLPLSYYAANSTMVYVRAVNNTYNSCFYTYPVILAVRVLPPNIQNAALSQCDPQVIPDGMTLFNLRLADHLFVGNNTALTVNYYLTDADARAEINTLPNNYTNVTAYNQTIFARIQNIATGCFRILPLQLNTTSTQYPIKTLSVCDNINAEDGYESFNLADAGYEVNGNRVTYYTSENDALLQVNAISSPYINTVRNYQPVYARIENSNMCLGIGRINLQVNSLPNVNVSDTAIVCLNTGDFVSLSADISGSQYSYLWSTGETSQYISVNQPGTYTVIVTNINTSCTKTRTIEVSASNVATIADITVTDLTTNNTITIVAVPTGGVRTSYLYSLDAPNGPWQTDPVFTDVSGGIHKVYAYDVNGCGITDKTVGVLQIPKFFSPNGDGNNDYWHIPGIAAGNYFNSLIYIYDRYGKLVANLKPQDRGWDGMYNGHPLPSTDYWYVINLTDGRIIKGHFSLIR